jgi:hypothetical protein
MKCKIASDNKEQFQKREGRCNAEGFFSKYRTLFLEVGKKTLRFLNPFTSKDIPKCISESAKEKALKIIGKQGYEAHFWFPSMTCKDDRELWDALEFLKAAGYIITDASGCLVGKVARVNLTSDEKARIRRAHFKLAEPK